ncbi:MAG: Hydroxyacylglutathione hydrolase GloB [Chlamydiia bacterium]|nr:Hydroxyacylglutathione hydrolase GloB [Chlamydiia bacterium]
MEKIIDSESSLEGEFSIYLLEILETNYTYLLAQKGVCLSIDPGAFEPVEEALKETGLELESILLTHHHPDHIDGAKKLKGDKKVPILGPKHKDIPFLDSVVADGDEISLGPFSMEVIHAPGHTMEHLMYYFPDLKLLFCGDVLFLGGCGKMFEGNEHHYFHTFEKIKKLPLDTRIFTGHNYNQRNIDFLKHLDPKFSEKDMNPVDHFHTLKQELKINPFLKAETPQDFLSLYNQRDEFRAQSSST